MLFQVKNQLKLYKNMTQIPVLPEEKPEIYYIKTFEPDYNRLC